ARIAGCIGCVDAISSGVDVALGIEICRYDALFSPLFAAASSDAVYRPSAKYSAPGLRAGVTSVVGTCSRRSTMVVTGAPLVGHTKNAVRPLICERGPRSLCVPF